MNLERSNIFFVVLILSIFIAGCSSSSTSQRYNQPKPNLEPPQTKKVRFTSVDSTETKSNSTKTSTVTYKNIPDSTQVEFDEIPVESNPIDKSKFVANYSKLQNFNIALTNREKILFEVIKYIDTPYKYGGNTENGIDCSAFTKGVYQNSIAIELPRTAREQYGVGEKIDIEELKFGDLIYFNTTKRSFPGHVGIYLGDDQFVHASRSLGVTVSSLSEPYYKKRFVGARRVEKLD
jgi:lipoprotein Spr